EKRAAKIRQQFVVKFPQKRKRSRIIRRERGRISKERTIRAFVRFGNFREPFPFGISEKFAEMAEGILIRHEIDSKFAATRIKPANLTRGERAPGLPHGLVLAVCKRVFGVELEFVDLEIRQLIDELQQRFNLWNAAARDVEHHAATRKIRPVADFHARQFA